MGAGRGEAAEEAGRVSAPILAGLGLELLEAAVTGPGRAPTLRLVVDRPDGGVTTDEIQTASREIERALEAADLFPGRYLLEVSSPGIDRPWTTRRDFERHVGARGSMTLAVPLADGRRTLAGRLAAVEGDAVVFEPDGGDPLRIPIADITRARPEIDWAALLKGRAPGRGARGGGDAP